MTADEIIETLRLAPHPEGGFYRETFRDNETATGSSRAASTAIYFLLKAGELSRWHKVDAVETWHHYSGAPLELSIAPPNGPPQRMVVGPDIKSGARPQAIVPTGHWQQARSLGDYSLVGCTVAPGFEFEGFTLAAPGFEPGK